MMLGIKVVLILFVGLALGALAPHAQADNPAEDSSSLTATDSLPTLWIAGDGMVASADPARGWGQDLHLFFDLQKLNIANKAAEGTLTEFVEKGKWKEIEAGLKPGDFVLVSFYYSFQPPSAQPTPPTRNGGRPPNIKSETREEQKQREDETRFIEEREFAKQIQAQERLLGKIAQSARLKQSKVILCTPAPRLFNFNPIYHGVNLPPSSPFTRVSPQWQAAIESCAKSNRSAIVDLSDIVTHAYDQLAQEKVRGLTATNGHSTNAEGARFNAQLVISGLRSIPTGPLEGFLNDAGREMPFLLGTRFRHIFTTTEGTSIDGVLISADGDSAEIMEFPTSRKITVITSGLTETDRKFIEEWKKENPTVRLSYQVIKTNTKLPGVPAKDQRHYYAITVKNASKDPTPELKLYYQYEFDIKKENDTGLGTTDLGKYFGNLDIPPIPALGSVTVDTRAIFLEDRSEVSSWAAPTPDGTPSRADRNPSLQYTTHKRKELLTGIAFDIYFGERLMDKYRANGFRQNTTLLKDSLGYMPDKP